MNRFTYGMRALTVLAVSVCASTVPASTIENIVDVVEGPAAIIFPIGSHTINSVIATGSDSDGYDFTIGAAKPIRIVVAGLTGNYDPFVELRDPMGLVIGTAACNGNPFGCSVNLDRALENPGTYRINVSDNGSNEAGSYTLHLDEFRPDLNYDGIAYDAAVNDVLGHRGDHDFLAFNGAANTIVDINVQGITGNLDPLLTVWSPSGDILAEIACNGNPFGCAFSQELSLTEDGIYSLGIFDSGLNETGSYRVQLNCSFGDCPFALDPPNGIPLVSAVPIPAALPLLGTAIVSLAGAGFVRGSRRRSNKEEP